MNKLTLLALLLFCSLSSFSQFHANLELGGSNFWGTSITGEYRVALYPKVVCYKKPRFYLAPKIGVGHVFDPAKSIVMQFGFAVGVHPVRSYNSFELNTNFSYLTKASLVNSTLDNNPKVTDPNFSGFYWCSGLDYKIKGESLIYTIGIGLFNEIYRYSSNNSWNSSDWLGMIKLGIGV